MEIEAIKIINESGRTIFVNKFVVSGKTLEISLSQNKQAAQRSVQRIGLWARIKKWFGAIANR